MSTVLIVDDSTFQQRLLRKYLEKEGHDLVFASNGKEALEQLARFTPTAIIMDLIMPVMDGRELLHALKEQGNTVPIIVSTADIQQTTYDECMALGARTVISKPIQQQALFRLLDEIEKDR